MLLKWLLDVRKYKQCRYIYNIYNKLIIEKFRIRIKNYIQPRILDVST